MQLNKKTPVIEWIAGAVSGSLGKVLPLRTSLSPVDKRGSERIKVSKSANDHATQYDYEHVV